MLEKMTWEEFIEGCDISHYRWVGVTPNIVFSLASYHVVRLSDHDILDDPDFEIIEELEDGYRIRWGNDPEDDVIVDDIGEAYLIVENVEFGISNYEPAFPNLFVSKEKAIAYIVDYIDDLVRLSDVMTPTEAAERWNVKRNTLIAALNRGLFKDQIERGLIKKYEPEHEKTQWYLTKQAMEEVYGEEIGRVEVEQVIEKIENFPIDGEMYLVGKTRGRYFFAWGPDYPYRDFVPAKDILDGESGIMYYESKEKALSAMKKAKEAITNT